MISSLQAHLWALRVTRSPAARFRFLPAPIHHRVGRCASASSHSSSHRPPPRAPAVRGRADSKPRLLPSYWAVAGLRAGGWRGGMGLRLTALRPVAQQGLALSDPHLNISVGQRDAVKRTGTGTGTGTWLRRAAERTKCTDSFSRARPPIHLPARRQQGAHGGMSRCCAQGELKLWCRHA